MLRSSFKVSNTRSNRVHCSRTQAAGRAHTHGGAERGVLNTVWPKATVMMGGPSPLPSYAQPATHAG
eukprot:1700996-Rhodomonas_salina.1